MDIIAPKLTVGMVAKTIEELAPIAYQADYDNSGLLVGNSNAELIGILLSLDVTEAVLNECLQRKCNLLVVHHPFLFKPIKSITGKNWIERCLLFAIKNDIAIYAAHTNLDHIRYGVNQKIGEKLRISQPHILQPATALLQQLTTYVPKEHAEMVKNALFEAGAGQIGDYSETSFSTLGIGSFKPSDNAKPFLGDIGKRTNVEEQKLEMVFPAYMSKKIVDALLTAHPYQEVAYNLISLKNTHPYVGAGMVGNLENPMHEDVFLELLQKKFNAKAIRHSNLLNKAIQRVAWCGGAGISLLESAIAAKADVFVTADIKYHDFFEPDNRILLVDIGHFESEQFTVEVFYELLKRKFANFAVYFTGNTINPVHYYL